MTLLERLNNIKDKMSDSLANIKIALTIKGVKTPETLKITEVAQYIRQVYQEEFEFVFNFRDIDQFGNPHVPNTGQSIGGMISISPSMEDVIYPEYTFNQEYNFDTVTVNFGIEHGQSSISVSMDDLTVTELEPFNEPTIPEVLNYDPSFETT